MHREIHYIGALPPPQESTLIVVGLILEIYNSENPQTGDILF